VLGPAVVVAVNAPLIWQRSPVGEEVAVYPVALVGHYLKVAQAVPLDDTPGGFDFNVLAYFWRGVFDTKPVVGLCILSILLIPLLDSIFLHTAIRPACSASVTYHLVRKELERIKVSSLAASEDGFNYTTAPTMSAWFNLYRLIFSTCLFIPNSYCFFFT
jgi:hypothetical protein